MLTRWISSPGRGQAPGPLLHPTQPLVPTGRLTSLAAFGRQHSLGEPSLFSEEKCLSLHLALLSERRKTGNGERYW